MDTELQYFEQGSENFKIYKSLFDKQAQEVCRNKINKQWIKNGLNDFSFCYAFIGLKAQLGRRSLKKIEDQYILKAFVLCKADVKAKFVKLKLICSKINLKLGKILLEIVEEKSRTLGLKAIVLDSLPDKPLIKWYENLGFLQMYMKNFKDGTEKAYFMQKFL